MRKPAPFCAVFNNLQTISKVRFARRLHQGESWFNVFRVRPVSH